MADSYSTKEITDLSTDSSVDDNDLYVVGNAGTSSMRKIAFSSIAEAIKTKLAAWTFNALNTTAKTLTGSINELNSSYNALSNYSGYPKVRYYNASNPINCNELPTGWALAVATGGNYPTSSGLYWVNSLAYAVNNNGSVNTGIQIAYVYDSNAEARYFRKVTNNTWSAWQLQPRKTDIDELNSNLEKHKITFVIVTSAVPASIPMTSPTPNYGVFMVFGFAQGIGAVSVLIHMNAGQLESCINLKNGTAFSNAALTFSISNNALIISSSYAGGSKFTVIYG